jgi:hypothetical protein
VEGFFRAYAAAFEARDVTAVSQLFAYPAHIATDFSAELRLVAIPSAEAFLPQLQALMDKYKRDGVKKIRVLNLTTTELSGRMCRADVHWGMLGLADLPLYDFDNQYVLGRLEQHWKIVSVASPNEMQRYRAFIGRG